MLDRPKQIVRIDLVLIDRAIKMATTCSGLSTMVSSSSCPSLRFPEGLGFILLVGMLAPNVILLWRTELEQRPKKFIGI